MMVYRCSCLFSKFDLNKAGRSLWLKMGMYSEDLQLGRLLLTSCIVYSRELILTDVGIQDEVVALRFTLI